MTYNFKNSTRVFLVSGGLRYSLDVYKDLNFSQTFSENSYKTKTLHNQLNLFEGATIVSAAPGNFSFTMPMLVEEDLETLLTLGTNYSNNSLASFDIYIVSSTETIKIETAVVTSIDFNMIRDSLLTVSISGESSRVYRVGDQSFSLPGTLQTRTTTKTFVIPKYISTVVNGSTLDYISSISVSLKNEIYWVPNNTVNAAMSVTNASNTIYPTQYVLKGRTLSGAIEQYVTENTTSYQSWSTNASLSIQVSVEQNPRVLSIVIPSAVYTNRVQLTDKYTQTFDFRMLSNPTDMSTVISYN